MSDADLSIAALCAACWVLGGVMWTAAIAVWVGRRLGITWGDVAAMARGR